MNDQGQPGKGRRFGVREFLLDTAKKYPDRLVIKTGAHVTRVLFERPGKDQRPARYRRGVRARRLSL